LTRNIRHVIILSDINIQVNRQEWSVFLFIQNGKYIDDII